MRLELEKYRGAKSRHTCPACNSRNCFTRYVGENGEYLSSDVGRCNRESKCGYHYKPKQFFADNPTVNTERSGQSAKGRNRNVSNYGFVGKNIAQTDSTNLQNKPDFIPFEHFKATLGNYEQNTFVRFLLNLFLDDVESVENVLKMYFVGTYDTYTCFPSIDRSNHICRAKLIRFNQTTGKRLKGDYDTSSLPAKLKLKEEFHYKQIFFGEHLLSKYPDKPIAIVEAEKTAIIASLCFPEFVWLGCNSKSWLKAERIGRLGNRQIILYPDADGFNLWQEIAKEARLCGLTVKVSNLIETHGTDAQKTDGYDLADYLISQQKEINEFNKYADDYNSKLETVLTDESLYADFETILDEQKAIKISGGELSESEAERQICNAANFRQVILSLT